MAVPFEQLLGQILRGLFKYAGPPLATPRTIIVGACAETVLLAAELAAAEEIVSVIEGDEGACWLGEGLQGVKMIHGNATDVEVLRRAGAGDARRVYSATADDGVNLRVCQSVEMAFDVPRLIARVNDKANAAEFELLGYEVMSLAKVAVTLLDGAEVTPGLLRLLQEKEAGESVAEVTIVSPVNVGRKLASLRLSGCDLVALRQDGAFSRVDELTTIGFGDVLTLFGSTKAIETAREQVNPPC